MHKKSILFALSPLFAQAVLAAEPTIIPPNAGSILQQTQQTKPQEASPMSTGLVIQQEDGSKLPPSAPFLVKQLRIEGNTLFDDATLHALVADVEGHAITLDQLGQVVDRITAYYRAHGYPLARAIVPAQTIEGGVVKIAVLEARYGKIQIDNRSRVGGLLLETTLSSLASGQQIEQKALDHALLLASDIPGAATTATLKPGATVGTADLILDVTTPQAVIANGALDNYGNRYTGRERLGGDVNVIDPLHHGDVFSVNALTSGSGMEYGRLGYDITLNGLGTHAGGAYSALHYELGDTLAAVDGHGTADVASLWVRHPFLRTPDLNLYGQMQYDHKQLDDEVDASNVQTNRHLDNWTASLSGDWRDGLLSDGAANVNTWSAAWEDGRVAFDNAAAQGADAATARTQGSFQKWALNASRLQSLTPGNALYLALSGQWANSNLDSSEKMVAGGPYTVRAYDMGVVSGDSGLLGNLELHHELGPLWHGQAQAIAFIDSEHVSVNKTTWAPGPNSATLSGAGLGLNWYGPDRWSIKATLAAAMGATPTLVGSNNTARAWLELGKAY